jgi:hypothetical protein
MSHVAELEQKIRDRLAAAERRRRQDQEDRRQRERARQQRGLHFRAVADRLLRQHIRPGLDRLAALFPARPLHAEEAGRNRAVYLFRPSADFTAGGTLELAVHHDLEVERLFLLYRFELLPVPFAHVTHDRLVLPLDGADEARAAAWVEERLLGALDVCLRLQGGAGAAEVDPHARPLAA